MNGLPVLVVDDDRALRDLLREVLTNEGYVVEVAIHGIDAVKKLDTFRPRLIILDLMLPAMDGWEFMKVYQEMRGLAAPVLAISAHPIMVLPHGITSFLPKPFDILELLQRVQECTLAQAA